MEIKFKKMWLFIISCLFLISCMGPKISINEDTVYDQPVAETKSEYIIGPGDVIELVYYVETRPSDTEYVLAVGDVINVEFLYHPEVNKEVAVRPDGKITLQNMGDIEAGGLTPTQLKENLERIYGEIFQKPVVTVTLVEYDQAIKQIQQTITSAPMGQSKKTTVRPDGYVSIPLIMKDIRAAGLTFPQLKKTIAMEYRKLNDRLSVTLILDQMTSNVVYVSGEVARPDYYKMDGPTTLTQILARAGGILDTAKPRSILVLSMNEERKPVGRLVDLNNSLGKGNIGNDVLLRQFDVVFVPKSTIAKIDLVIDQYVNNIIPDAFRSGLMWSYDLDNNNNN